jgi:hypothetical protein
MTLPTGIDALKSTIGRRGGVARSNRFAVYMTHPNKKQSLVNTDFSSLIGNAARSLINGGSISPSSFIDDPRDMYLLCESVNLPGRQITTTEHYTSMKAVKKPYGFLNEDVSMSFHLTNDYYAYKYMKGWMDLIISTEGDNGFYMNFKDNYTTDIIIQQMGNTDYIPVHTVRLINAYPITLNSIELNNGSENDITKVSVTFAYDNWEDMGLIDSYANLIGKGADLVTNVGKLF